MGEPGRSGSLLYSWPCFFNDDLFVEHHEHLLVKLPEIRVFIRRENGPVYIHADPELEFVVIGLQQATEYDARIGGDHPRAFRKFLETVSLRNRKKSGDGIRLVDAKKYV
jgi:hypothetical protein